MTLLHLPTTTHPYNQLQADYPATLWPANPTAEDLALGTHGEVVLVTETPQPSYDPATQRVEPAAPVEVDGQWTQPWALVELSAEEQAAYANANRPAPDWTAFGAAMLASPGINALLAAAIPLAPAPALALPAALVSISNGGGYATFQAAWGAVTAAVPPSAELRAEVLAAAEAAHLPAGFLELLSVA